MAEMGGSIVTQTVGHYIDDEGNQVTTGFLFFDWASLCSELTFTYLPFPDLVLPRLREARRRYHADDRM